MAALTNTTSARGRIPAHAISTTTVYPEDFATRFDNLSAQQLADEIGRIDAIQKAADAELKALKDEFKARGLTEVAGDFFAVTATDQISWRLDTKAVRAHLGAAVSKFETVASSTVIRVKAADRRAIAA